MPAINIAAVLALVQAAEEAAIEEVADLVAADARARAPVRKVFHESSGFRRKFRPLTSPEKALATKRVLSYPYGTDFARRRSVAYIARYARAEVRRPGSANALVRSRSLRFLGTERGGRFSPANDAVRRGRGFTSASLHPLLTARGRYEVASGRAIHRESTSSGTRVQIGGALKASIENEGAVQSGDGTVARISARIRYAKYVEFPTTRNASQPFLLPALHGARGRLRSALATQIKQRLGG